MVRARAKPRNKGGKMVNAYPWEDWLYYGKLRLVRGVDFFCEPYIMAQQFRNKMQGYVGRISVGIVGNELTINITEE